MNNIKSTIEKAEKELLEKCADIEHQRWSDWQNYCHKTIIENNGYIPEPYPFEHWERQMRTPYSQLSEKEKESDREQVRRYLPLVHSSLQDTLKAVVEMVGAIPTSYPERESDEFEAGIDIAKSIIIGNLKSCIK